MRDEVCPASTILPVFERITAPKALNVYLDLTHTPCTDFNAHTMHWLGRYLREIVLRMGHRPSVRSSIMEQACACRTLVSVPARACLPDF